jgi:hypothetical protein
MVSYMRRVTIFRPGKVFGGAMRVRYYLDGVTEIASAKRGETVKFDIDENEHSLRAYTGVFSKTGTGSNVIIISAGTEDKEYEFRFGAPGLTSATLILTELQPGAPHETGEDAEKD